MKYINSNNFAGIANFVFSEIVKRDYFFKTLNNSKLLILQENSNKDGDFIWYINPEIQISENDVIFSHTEVVEYLFRFLDDLPKIKNLKLITHQSDRPVDKRLWELKPNSISEWYSTNVIYKSQKLFSVPLGIGNDYLNIYKNHVDTIESLLKTNTVKKQSAFLNFRINTNTVERLNTYFSLKEKEWIDLKTSKQNPKEYLTDMNNSKFTICPWGNGYDTHRLWESMYLESIPVTKYHPAYKQFDDLPIIFIKSWKKLNLDYLDKKVSKLNRHGLKKLNLDYWVDTINKVRVSGKETYNYMLNQKDIEKILLEIKTNFQKRKKIKKFKTFINKFHYLKLRHYFTVKNF